MVILPRCKEWFVVNSLAARQRRGAETTSQNLNGSVAQLSPKRRAGFIAAD
jgi:hypothetical protein